MITANKYLSVLLLLLLRCGQSPKSDINKLNTEKNNSIDTISDINHSGSEIKNEMIESGDSLIIKGICAVLYIPDSLKIVKMKKESDEESFSLAVDDNQHYLAKSRKFLQEQGINIVDTRKKYFVFIKNNGERTIFSTDKPELDWGLLLFDGIREPVQGDLIDTEDDYVKYFSSK